VKLPRSDEFELVELGSNYSPTFEDWLRLKMTELQPKGSSPVAVVEQASLDTVVDERNFAVEASIERKRCSRLAEEVAFDSESHSRSAAAVGERGREWLSRSLDFAERKEVEREVERRAKERKRIADSREYLNGVERESAQE